jgi:hypothetical protein
MSSYEQALSAARRATPTVPEFEAVAAASDADRKRWNEEDRDVRARARLWLLVGGAAWLALPLMTVIVPDAFAPDYTAVQRLAWYTWLGPVAAVMFCAARLSQRRQFRANMLTRGIAASNLVMALITAFVEDNSSCLFAMVLAVASGRSLQLLGERGLDGSDDHSSDFEPVKFRGILILSLVMACADIVTLLWSFVGGVASWVWAVYLLDGYGRDDLVSALPYLGLTAAGAALMAINVWGLLRLRTWALFGSMLTNIGVAALVASLVLAVGNWVAITLVTTAAIQLLLPLPILAAALGREDSRRYTWVAPMLLRVVVPGMVLLAIIVAVRHLSWSFPG